MQINVNKDEGENQSVIERWLWLGGGVDFEENGGINGRVGELGVVVVWENC